MLTAAARRDEKSHSAGLMAVIFLVCAATCGVFFSLGFLVGYNERGLHLGPATEVVSPPAPVPPAVTPPPEGEHGTPAESSAAPPAQPVPESGNPSKPAATPAETAGPPGASGGAAAGEAASAAGSEVGEGITVQVVALRNREDAETVVGILKTKGYPVFMVTPEYAGAQDSLFRVQVGPFKTREDAERVRSRLAQDGFKPFVRR